MSNKKSVKSVGSVVALLLLFFSCATAPNTPDPFREEETAFIPLEPGASVYLFVDVPGCRPVLDLVPIRELDKSRSEQILDLTQYAVAALYPEGSDRRFQALAWGSYSGFRAGLAFAFDKNWKKSPSKNGPSYWYSVRDGLSVSLKNPRAFVSGAGPGNKSDPFTGPPGTEIPPGFNEFRRGAVLALWLNDPGAEVNRLLDALGLPLRIPAEQLFVSLFSQGREGEGGQYEALVRIQTPSASQAQALLVLINMARIFTPELGKAQGPAALASALFANPPVQDGRNLNLRTAKMSEEEIALLFRLFSVYSGETISK